MNEIWKCDSNYLFAYTDNRGVMEKIKRSYPDFVVVGEYFRFNKLFARQYRVPIKRKRSIVRLLGVKVGELA